MRRNWQRHCHSKRLHEAPKKRTNKHGYRGFKVISLFAPNGSTELCTQQTGKPNSSQIHVELLQKFTMY